MRGEFCKCVATGPLFLDYTHPKKTSGLARHVVVGMGLDSTFANTPMSLRALISGLGSFACDVKLRRLRLEKWYLSSFKNGG